MLAGVLFGQGARTYFDFPRGKFRNEVLIIWIVIVNGLLWEFGLFFFLISNSS